MKVNIREVVITGRKPPIERKIDRTVINVDAFITNAGSNALEVLERAPGIQVDNDNIILKGKQSITIYVDDKPLYLQGSDLANYLRSLPAGMLDKVEIMPNPSAKYDAAGNGGIINIRLKKTKTKGFNGSIVSDNTQGVYTRIAQIGNFNLRYNRINIYGNATNFNGAGLYDAKSNRYYPVTDKGSLQSVQQHTYSVTPNNRTMGKLGVDFFATTKTTLGIAFSRLHRALTEKKDLSGRQTYSGQDADSLLTGSSNMKSTIRNTTFSMSYRHTYDSSGRELTADLDYIQYGLALSMRNRNSIGQHTEMLDADLPSSTDIYSVKMDYTHPFTKDTRLEAGYKSSFAGKNSTGAYFMASDGQMDTSLNRFRYRENIHAAYVNFSTSYRKFSFQTGLRLEQTISEGSGDTSFSRRYTDLFPSLFLAYKLDNKNEHLLHLSYSRRIDRPDYTDLNPFAIMQDRYTYREGNPLLRPQLSNNLELSYIFQSNFTATLFFNQIVNGINETIVVRDHILYRRPDNIGQKHILGFSLDGTLHPAKWWTASPAVIYSYTSFYNPRQTVRGGSWNISGTHQFQLGKGWDAEAVTGYTSPQAYTQYIQAGTWYIHCGISKKILRDKGAITLGFRDILYTRVDRQNLTGLQGITGFNSRTHDTRNATISFSYRFSKGIKSTRRSREIEESNRLGEH